MKFSNMLILKVFIKFKNYSKIEPYVIKQLLHLNLINMRFYGAEHNLPRSILLYFAP
jgi:hypothetical protein